MLERGWANRRDSPMAGFRDRIVELRKVRASELRKNVRNWRLHPEGQRSALAGMLADVGFVGALIAREVPGGLELLDGHLRADIAGDTEVPVLIADVDDRDAEKILATYDPLGALALVDTDALAGLLEVVELDEHAELRKLLADLHDELVEDVTAKREPLKEVEGMALQPHEHYDYLVVLATTPQEWNVLCDRLGLVPEKRRSRMGTCRAIRAAKLLPLLSST
jgi:hypothetical protein